MVKERITFGHRVLGEIDYDNKTYLTFKNENHFFRNFEGFGASVKLLDYLIEKGIEMFIVNYNNQDFYYVDVLKFITKGHEWTDNGNDHQLILHIGQWELYNPYKDIKIIKVKNVCATVPQNSAEVIGTPNEKQGTL